MATNLFCQQLRTSIKEGKAKWGYLCSFISSLSHLEPFLVTDSRKYGFLWLGDILSSGYTDDERYHIACGVVKLLWKHYDPGDPEGFSPSWIPPLLGFLSLCEKSRHGGVLFALDILLSSPRRYSDFGPTILPVLVPILLPAHPLQSRGLALRIFHKFVDGWFSSQMEDVLYKDLDILLQAIGDPFQSSDTPLPDERRITHDYEPMMAMIVLIEFASSDLWRNHLHHSNFTSCEAALSTEEGRKTALRCMLNAATRSWTEFFCTPTKIIATIRRLQELRCLNTAEVVILWAWTAGVVNVVDRDGRRSIERNTLDFYQTHGILRRLAALSRHITDTTIQYMHLMLLLTRYQHPCRVRCVQQLVSFEEALERLRVQHYNDLRVAQVCQLRGLYHLFGYNSTTWKGAVGVEEVGEEVDTLSGRSVAPTQTTDWMCDYP